MKINNYLVRAGKLVTVSKAYGTIADGAFFVQDGIIKDIGEYSNLSSKYKNIKTLDYLDYVVTPSLVDCHTHVLEYAPPSVYCVKNSAHVMGGISLLLRALSSGVSALGEQVCGSPGSDLLKQDYVSATKNLPMDIVFSLSSISIGLNKIVHFTGVTGSSSIRAEMLLDDNILDELIEQSDYPGENIFINATPANLVDSLVPNAGKIIYTQQELNKIADKFHEKGKKIGCHVAGEEAINMAINAKFNVIHHGHGITKDFIQKVQANNICIVATPLGGTHMIPNSPDEIAELFKLGIITAISSDGYLPPSTKAPWLSFADNDLRGPESLMLLAHPAIKLLLESGHDENEILKLITLNPAAILNKDTLYGNLEIGKCANFLISNGIPGLEVTDQKDILEVYFAGDKVISKLQQ